jgi:hypothetical protein
MGEVLAELLDEQGLLVRQPRVELPLRRRGWRWRRLEVLRLGLLLLELLLVVLLLLVEHADQD